MDLDYICFCNQLYKANLHISSGMNSRIYWSLVISSVWGLLIHNIGDIGYRLIILLLLFSGYKFFLFLAGLSFMLAVNNWLMTLDLLAFTGIN